MPVLSKIDKALRAVRERRVSLVVVTAEGVTLRFTSDKPDPTTLMDRVYTTSVYTDADGLIVRECTCPASDYHPTAPRCCHVALAELLWRPDAQSPPSQ
jgi:hypothetical protein